MATRRKDIKGYEELYKISRSGKVKGLKRFVLINRTNSEPYYKIFHEKILDGHVSNKGYLRIDLWKEGQSKKHSIHKLVASAFVPNPFNLPEVNHKDGNKLNNNDWNLEWTTRKENQEHALKTGLLDTILFTSDNNQMSKGVINTRTGKKYKSIKEAYNNEILPYCYSNLYFMLTGKYKNRSDLQLLKNV